MRVICCFLHPVHRWISHQHNKKGPYYHFVKRFYYNDKRQYDHNNVMVENAFEHFNLQRSVQFE